MFATVQKYGRDLSLAATGLVLSGLASAQAVGDPFDTVITTATTSVGKYAAALVVLSGVAVVFMIGMKYIKRIPRAA